VIESSSYLSLATFAVARNAAGFMARSAARALEAEGRLRILAMEVPVELPPVGVMTLRERPLTSSAVQMIDYLRRAAAVLKPSGGVS